MCKTQVENRMRLIGLIFSMGPFTKTELIQQFERESPDSIEIDTVDTVGDFVDYLADNRILVCENWKYRPRVTT